MALNGSSEEREQIASWLRWTHKNIHGSISPETRKEMGLSDDIDHYGYVDELKVYVMETLTWSTIAFQDRFGRCLSPQAKDSVVLANTCAAMRLGVPQSVLATNYDDFLVSFNRRLDRLDAGCALTGVVIRGIEASVIDLGNKRWITSIALRAALMIGFSLLPKRVQSEYQLSVLRSCSARVTQRLICGLLWLVYPFIVWLPLRGIICLLLICNGDIHPQVLGGTNTKLCLLYAYYAPCPMPCRRTFHHHHALLLFRSI